MTEQATAPSREEFFRLARGEFAFMTEFGFREVPPPVAEFQNPFEVHYEKDGWRVVVEGLSYGFDAHVTIRSPDGKIGSLGHFRPAGFWEMHRQKFARGQQGEIGYWALSLREYGTPFLRGEWSVFKMLLQKQEAWLTANRETEARNEQERLMVQAIERADAHFKAGLYSKAAEVLSPFEKHLPGAQVKKLEIARKRTRG